LPDYNGASYQTITTVTGITGHPEGITTANRVSYNAGATNPGVALLNPAQANTKYTISAWVYHETVPPAGGQAFAMAGLTSSTPTTPVAGVWQRLSWTYTTTASPSYFGFRVASPTGSGSFLITGILIERSGFLGDFFDGAGASRTNLANDPRALTITGTTGVGWRNSRWFGGNGTTVGTHTNITGMQDGPTPQLTTYIRKQWTGDNLSTSNGDTGFELSTGFNTTAGVAYAGGWSVQAGVTYSLSAWLRPTSDKGNAGFDMTWRDSAGYYITRSTFSTYTLPANVWTRVTATVTAPSGAITAGLVLDVDGGSLWKSGESLDGTGLIIERTDTPSTIFYEGTGDFSYSWTGTANNSASIQTAAGTPAIGGANNGITYRSGISGNYFARTFFTSDQIMDSGPSLQGTAPGLTASKTYTLSVDVWVDRDRTYRLSVQGNGTTNTSTSFTQTAGTTVRRIITFQTNVSATGPSNVALYVLRSDVLPGYIDVSKILIEEAPQALPYFDGSNPVRNLAAGTNPSALSGITMTSGVSYKGDTWRRASVAAGNSGWIVRQYVNLFDLIPGQTYTAAVTVANDSTADSVSIALDWCDTAATTVTLAPGEVRRLRVTNSKASYSNVYRFADLQVNQNTAGSRSVLFKDFTVEFGATPGYQGAADYTTAWTGVVNGSTSTMTAPLPGGWSKSGNTVVIPTTEGISGKGIKIIKNGGYGFVGTTLSGLAVSTAYTWSADILTSQTTVNTVDRSSLVGGYSPSDRTVVSDLVTRIQRTFTTGPSETTRTISIAGWENATVPDGSILIIDNIQVEANGQATPFFSGDTPAANEFTYAWTGTQHASTSTETAPGASGYTGSYSNRIAWQSTQWSASGTKSLAVAGGAPSQDSFSQFGQPYPFPADFAGKTYTILARLRTEEAFPVGADGRAWGVHIAVNTTGAQVFFSLRPNNYNTLPAGVYEVRQTITMPANATNISFMRFYNGSPNRTTVWWDNFMVVEGRYDGGYINPDQNPLAKWDGAANVSTSVGYPPTLLELAGKPSLELVGEGISPTTTVDGFVARTLYAVYEVTDINQGSWQVPIIYGVASSEGYTLQSNSAGTIQMVPRADFATGGGNTNATTGFNTRTSGRVHVMAFAFNDGLTSMLGMGNGATDVQRTLVPGTVGWTKHKLEIRPAAQGMRGVYASVYMGEHSRATRLAISRYLGNKYGANVA